MPLLNRDGPTPETWTGDLLPPEALADEASPPPAGPLALDWPSDRDPAGLAPWLDRLALVCVRFPAMSDGRGFSIARRLRAMGYAGRLRASGPLIADQAAAAWAVGFDELEIPESVMARQPEAIWSQGARPSRPSYQHKLGLR
ncbi:DUF934 domain-containing protein [Amaricoccus sp.]|uniref:DUF934 domain-containing protein n=1 Tax=Amaricoccus sp. TaxID=1872485 RepID=UPI001B76F264|nr:DUF934 domain-containing protein [Amaricoccus sp.]MBP7001280.1 DUF934 domain-containing protein [Amaricoccus sp.]